MTEKNINQIIGLMHNWRRWKFGDAWPRGLRLADQTKEGKVIVVEASAPAHAYTVKIEGAAPKLAQDLKANYLPMGFWTNSITGAVQCHSPQYCKDHNLLHEVMMSLTPEQRKAVRLELLSIVNVGGDNSKSGARRISALSDDIFDKWFNATALQKATAIVQALKLSHIK